MIEHVEDGANVLAIIIRRNYRANGIRFFTPGNYSQQLGYMNRPRGYVIEPHIHKAVAREVSVTQEVLFLKSGRVRVDFYSQDQDYLESRELHVGDIILLAAGGHGFEMLEASEIIEVKQGPYCGDEDKARFKAVSERRPIKRIIYA